MIAVLNIRKIDPEEHYGDGHRARHAQRGSQETLPAADQSDGTEALDEANPLERGIYVAKEKPGARKYKGVRREGKRQG
jgi:hypothetical protein